MSKVLLSVAVCAALFLAAPLMAAPSTANPLLQPWVGPYGGVPAFDKVKVEQFKPALEAAMAEQLKEIDAITANQAPADFENTIAAMERAGRTFSRVQAIYGVFSSTMS